MHQEVLTKEAAGILHDLRQFKGFYLAGGTALALQLGHRISVDFDFFSKQKIEPSLLNKTEKIFLGHIVSILVNNSNELSLLVGKTKLTFLYYPFPLLFKLLKFQGLNIASAREIAVTKAYTIGRRGTLKDYADLYFALDKKIVNLRRLIQYAEKKYKDAFNSRLFLEQLIYFEDIQNEPLRFLRKKVSHKQLKAFFESEIKKIKL